MTNQIYPCLWFNGQAKEAATFYCSIFKDAKIIVDTPMVVTFIMNGNKFMCLNGGPQFKFNEAVSFVVNGDTQDGINYYWAKLTAGGEESRCGWLKDKFGVSWQIVPTILASLMSDPIKREWVVKAFMKMKKLDIGIMKNA